MLICVSRRYANALFVPRLKLLFHARSESFSPKILFQRDTRYNYAMKIVNHCKSKVNFYMDFFMKLSQSLFHFTLDKFCASKENFSDKRNERKLN